VSQTSYDDLGRVASETDARGNVTLYAYNGEDQITTKTLQGYDLRLGGTTNVVLEQYEYDLAGRETASITANGTIRQCSYYNSSGLLSERRTATVATCDKTQFPGGAL
jgi:YD repeat-containing protein